MDTFDALRAAESIVARAALSITPSPTAGLRLPAQPPPPEGIDVKIISVHRGVVTAVDVETGLTRRLIAPPLIAESLKRSYGIVRLEIDDRDHILYIEQ
ncbi:MAG: hypothetical protein NVSMB64_12400 [Candidatus Velthaea sp.]